MHIPFHGMEQANERRGQRMGIPGVYYGVLLVRMIWTVILRLLL